MIYLARTQENTLLTNFPTSEILWGLKSLERRVGNWAPSLPHPPSAIQKDGCWDATRCLIFPKQVFHSRWCWLPESGPPGPNRTFETSNPWHQTWVTHRLERAQLKQPFSEFPPQAVKEQEDSTRSRESQTTWCLIALPTNTLFTEKLGSAYWVLNGTNSLLVRVRC